MLNPTDSPMEGQSPTRWFIVVDDARRPLSVHRLVDLRRFSGEHVLQVYNAKIHRWDTQSPAQRGAIEAATEADHVLEVDEPTAAKTMLELLGRVMLGDAKARRGRP